ncbi:ABC transporter ATP-binding protein [Rubricoccus marinus]|uniref:ABC transporter n=1 Tax=Rubricoccus marinus TaxID=716817 RepID=A0A259TZY5_9BACT|nr:ABC transporter ATP-binding protein [Rubricoccus marinus]OZC03291.1 ABC transporter [Rubricoccus marinus]
MAVDRPHPALSVRDLAKTFDSGGRPLTVLNGVSFDVAPGDTLAIVGPSGSGKTTLLGLAAGLDRPSRGSVTLAGTDLGPLSEDARARLRAQHVGFVFQSFRLLQTLTALDNVAVPLELKGASGARGVARDLLERVGLGDRTDHYPTQLSGGEQQRVAVARAFAGQPALLFADEPTGNLDEATGARVEDLLFDLNREAGTALVVVTHDLELAARCSREIRLRGGQVEYTRDAPATDADPGAPEAETPTPRQAETTTPEATR